MAGNVKPVPEGYQSVTPYLLINGAAKAIDFYKQVFGATELMRFDAPGGKIGHAELMIGDSRLMLADEYPEMGFKGPQSYGGSGVLIHLYVTAVDAVVAKATAAGARIVKPVQDQFYGDRTGTFEDPFGHLWGIATHIEDVSMEEMKRRVAAMAGGH